MDRVLPLLTPSYLSSLLLCNYDLNLLLRCHTCFMLWFIPDCLVHLNRLGRVKKTSMADDIARATRTFTVGCTECHTPLNKVSVGSVSYHCVYINCCEGRWGGEVRMDEEQYNNSGGFHCLCCGTCACIGQEDVPTRMAQLPCTRTSGTDSTVLFDYLNAPKDYIKVSK